MGSYEDVSQIAVKDQALGNAAADVGRSFGAVIAGNADKAAKAQSELDARKRAEAEQARIRAEQNWAIRKDVEKQKVDATIKVETTMVEQGVDAASMDNSLKGVIDVMFESEKALASSRGDYDGREEDEANIRNGKRYLASFGDRLSTMNSLSQGYNEAKKLFDKGGGIDPGSTNPLYSAMMEIDQGSGTGINKGTVKFSTRRSADGTLQTFQIADSPRIRELNNGKPYEINYEDVHRYMADDDNNPNTFGLYNTIPDYTTDIKKTIADNKINDANGTLTMPDGNNQGGFMTVPKKGGKFNNGTVINKDSKGTYQEQLAYPDTAAIFGAVSENAAATAEVALSQSASSVTANAYIRSKASNRNVTKEVPNPDYVEGGDMAKTIKQTYKEYYFTPAGKLEGDEMVYRNTDNGELIQGEEIILGNDIDGLLTQDTADANTIETFGYSKEEYDNYIAFQTNIYLEEAGGKGKPINTPISKRDYISTFGGSDKAGDEYAKVVDDVYNKIQDDPAKVFGTLTNSDVEFDKDNPNIITFEIDGQKQKPVDLGTEKGIKWLGKLLATEYPGLGTGKDRDRNIGIIVEKLNPKKSKSTGGKFDKKNFKKSKFPWQK